MFKKRAVKQQTKIKVNQQQQQQNRQKNKKQQKYRQKNKQQQNKQQKQHKQQQNRQKKQQQNKQHKQQQQQQQQIQRQNPSKKQKPDSILFYSTTQRKQLQCKQIHSQLKSLNYKAQQTLISSFRQPSHNNNSNYNEQLILQQQLAKQKYLQNIESTVKIKQGQLEPSIYRGINNYANYSLTQDQIINGQQKFRKRQGPSRVNTTIRNTCRFDYNFGLCKDWHDSGYCPFGDSCLYLHDRSNYKTGWEQQRDFEKTQKQRWKRINNPQLALKQQLQQSLKQIQKYKPNLMCQKCHSQYKNPVQVDCLHIYCSSCAIKLTKCVICKKNLSGIMNNAQKKLNKMKQIYEQMKKKILKQNEQNKMKKKKYNNVNSQDVFAQ